MTDWIVREAGSRDREELLRTEERLFPRGEALNAPWLFDESPMGRALVLVAVTASDRIAGTRALLPWDLRSAGRNVRVGQYARSWTLPEFRNQGVSVAIGNALNRAGADLGYPFIFLFPSVRSIPGHRRIGNRLDTLLERRQAVTSWKYFWRASPGSLDSVLRWVRRMRGSRAGGFWKPAEAVEKEADGLWPRTAGNAEVQGRRDGAFVAWRYHSHTGRTYRILRYPDQGPARLLAVVLPDPRRTRIVDLWGDAEPDEASKALCSLVEDLSRSTRFVEWCPPRGSSWVRAAGKAGLLRRRTGVPVARWFIAKENELGPLADLESYRLTEGDSDYA